MSDDLQVGENFLDDVLDIEEVEQESEKVELSKEEFEKLSSGSKTNEQIAAVLEKLSRQTEAEAAEPADPGDPFAVVLNAEDIDDEEFENSLWDRGKAKRTIEQLLERKVQPLVKQAEARTLSLELRAELAENEDLKPYAKEIKQMISSLPPEKRVQAGIVQAAISAVRQKHGEEILNSKVEKLVEERLAAAGVGSSKTGGKSPATEDFSEGLGNTGGSGVSGKPKIRMTAAKKEEYMQRAYSMGMSFDDYVRYIVQGGE